MRHTRQRNRKRQRETEKERSTGKKESIETAPKEALMLDLQEKDYI